MMRNNPMLAVALLALTLVCGTVLCALGVMTKTEMLPLLGGTVVVAHRMLDGALLLKKGSTIPPPASGVLVLFGIAFGGLASVVSQVW